MDLRAHIVFMARMFLLLIVFLSNQLPLSYDFRIDSDQFLGAFSFSVNGTRESIGPWPNGPGYRRPPGSPASTAPISDDLVAQKDLRSAIVKRWRLHYNRYAAHIPYAVVHEKFFEIDDTGALLHAPTTISTSVDALGNPIELGGRQAVKVTPPMSAAKRASSILLPFPGFFSLVFIAGAMLDKKKEADMLKKLAQSGGANGTSSILLQACFIFTYVHGQSHFLILRGRFTFLELRHRSSQEQTSSQEKQGQGARTRSVSLFVVSRAAYECK